jgi:hypothetical protein
LNTGEQAIGGDGLAIPSSESLVVEDGVKILVPAARRSETHAAAFGPWSEHLVLAYVQ